MGSTATDDVRGKEMEGFKTFGHALKPDFPTDPTWRNMNHGSYGTFPIHIRDKMRDYQDKCEFRPDPFIRREVFDHLDASRAAVAKIVNAPVETVTFVECATTGVNTVLRNLVWNDDGKDTIICFSTIYDACSRAEDFIVDYFAPKVSKHEIQLDYPLEHEEVIAAFRHAVKEIEAQGKRARVCLFDVVSSNPGLVFPWEQMVATCRELGVQSLVDGAQGIGMVHIDLSAVKPDFFVSNCHKWLHAPRGSAVFYVPVENQDLIPSTLATARGYMPKNGNNDRTQPLPDTGGKNHFIRNFEWSGTRDDSPYLCVKDAIEWRRDVLGGEDRIISYQMDLNKKGIQRVADILGTDVLDNKAGTLTNCAMANVALPIWVGEGGKKKAPEGAVVVSDEEAPLVYNFLSAKFMEEYKTFMAAWTRWDRFWVRISSQVYLEMDDYDWAGKVLKELSERVAKGEFRTNKASRVTA